MTAATGSPPLVLVEEDGPGRAAEDAVLAGLTAHNTRFGGPEGHDRFGVFLRDPGAGAGAPPLAGALCDVYWGWLRLDVLWVGEALRGGGHGARLLAAAEGAAWRRGARRGLLDTFDFQAEGFYAARGWRVFGRVEALPGGYGRVFMTKDLAPPDEATA